MRKYFFTQKDVTRDDQAEIGEMNQFLQMTGSRMNQSGSQFDHDLQWIRLSIIVNVFIAQRLLLER